MIFNPNIKNPELVPVHDDPVRSVRRAVFCVLCLSGPE